MFTVLKYKYISEKSPPINTVMKLPAIATSTMKVLMERYTNNHSLSQQGVWAPFEHPNLQNSPLRSTNFFGGF